MSCVCIGCGAEARGSTPPPGWHTGLVEVSNVGSRTTAKIRVLNFCPCCEPVYRRLGAAMCADDEPVPDLVATLDERPALFNVAPAMAR
jgi:hypothetical protein